MPDVAAHFWTQAPQLHGHAVWTEFVSRLRELAQTDWYQYDKLATLIGYQEDPTTS